MARSLPNLISTRHGMEVTCSQRVLDSFVQLLKRLTLIGTGFVRLMLTPDVLAMHRVIIGLVAKGRARDG